MLTLSYSQGFHNTDLGKTVTADGQRTGKIEKALNGTNNKFYYITPIEFFSEVNDTNDKADTAAKSLWVLNRDNEAKQVAASGTRILLPDMGSGKLRTRYPIMPLSYEGSACWKELTALKVNVTLSLKTVLLFILENVHTRSVTETIFHLHAAF